MIGKAELNDHYPMAMQTLCHTQHFFTSQIIEHWFSELDVVKMHAKYYKASEVVPDDILNEGFSTIEYISYTLLDIVNESLSLNIMTTLILQL